MTWSRRAITLLSLPSAHANMIRARRDRRGPIAIDVPASPIGAVRLRSRSAQPWGVPFACSPTRRAYERAALFVSVFMVTAH